MANMSYHIANLLEKMLSTDKDFRFMATNDLMSELQVSNSNNNNNSSGALDRPVLSS